MYSRNKKVALTFDTELWSETCWLQPFIGGTAPVTDRSFEKSITAILEALAKRGHRATFFVTDTVVKKFPEYVVKIAAAGHEVGSHGIGHQRLTETSYASYAPAFKEHLREIEQLTGKKVLGFRAPHFSLTAQSSWILGLLEECGLRYDSSIFPLGMRDYGASSAPRMPYYIKYSNPYNKSNSEKLIEVPISITSFAYLPLPFAGGVYFRVLPLWLFRYFLWKESWNPHPPILFFHPHELEATTPKIRSGPLLKRLLKYWGIKNSFYKFEKMLDWYIFDSVENIYL